MRHCSATWHDLLYPGKATDFFTRRTLAPFDPAPQAFNRDNACWLMELSRLVYRHDIEERDPPPQPTRSQFLANAGFRQRKFFLSRETDTQAMLVEPATSPSYAVLAFRGTEQNGSDLKTDFHLWKDFIVGLEAAASPLKTSKICVHEGFREALDSVWPEIADELAALRVPVFYTGHSLGAALATLAAARHAPQAVYTFGSPMVGNQAFVSSLAGIPIYRVVNDEDLVTIIPPKALGFCHAGTEKSLPPTGYKHALDRLLDCPPKPLADHTPILYLDRI